MFLLLLVGIAEAVNISIGGLFDLGSWIDWGSAFTPDRCAFDLAIADANAEGFVPGVNFSGISLDTLCAAGPGIAAAVDLVLNYNVTFLVGCGCSVCSGPVASYAGYFKYPQISHSSTSPTLSDKATYPFFARTLAPDTKQAVAWVALCQRYGWDRVGLLTSSEEVHSQLGQAFINLAALSQIQVTSQTVAPNGNLSTIFAQFDSAVIRILFVACYQDLMAAIWEEAPLWNMTSAGYAMITSDAGASSSSTTCAYSGVLHTIPGVSTPAIEAFTARMRQECGEFDPYAPFAYEAVYAFGHAMKAAFAKNTTRLSEAHTEGFRVAVMNELFGIQFDGLTGRVVLDENGDREGSYQIVNCKGTEKVVVGSFLDSVLSITGTVNWPGDVTDAPLDTQSGDFPGVVTVFPDWAIALLVILGVIVVAFVPIGIRIYRHPRHRRPKEPNWEKVVFNPEFLSELLTETSLTKTGRQTKRLNELVQNETLWPTLLLSISELGKSEKQLCEDFVFLLARRENAVPFILRLMKWELERAQVEEAVFREDTVFNKCFRVYVRLAALPFLWNTLSRPLSDFIDHQGGDALELDANKLEAMNVAPDQLYSNRIRLERLCLDIVDSILSNIHLLPESFLLLLQEAHRMVQEHWPSSTAVASIGNLLFLRTLIPALINPSLIGLSLKMSAGTRRDLVLVGKVLQNLANQVEFGEKETFMTGLNGFLSASIPRVAKLYKRLARGKVAGQGTPIRVPDAVDKLCLRRLYSACFADPRRLREFLKTKFGVDIGDTTGSKRTQTKVTGESTSVEAPASSSASSDHSSSSTPDDHSSTPEDE